MQIVLGIVLSLLAGGVAAVVYAWLVWWLDRHEKEPWWLLTLVFLWGAIPAVVLALVIELILDIPISVLGPGLAHEIAGGSLVAPIVEEITKGMAVFGVLFFVRRELDNVLDGIVYGAMAGLGFAFTENIFYFVGSLMEQGWGGWVLTVFMRAIMFGLNHAFFTGVTGGALGYARLSRNILIQVCIPLLGLNAAAAFHAIHNLGAALAGITCLSLLISLFADWGGFLMLGIVIALVWRQERNWIRTQLRSEVGTALRPEDYQLTASYRQRMRTQLRALLRGDFSAWTLHRRLAQTATELAFKKHQLSTLGDEGNYRRIIHELRKRLIALRDL